MMLRRILKRDDERRRLYGVALVADEVDLQGDRLGDLALEDAAVRAVKRGAVVKVDHGGQAVGRLVAGWPLTRDIAAALGVTRPGGRSVWLVGLEIEDPAVWERVRAGEVGHALSIGGRAAARED